MMCRCCGGCYRRCSMSCWSVCRQGAVTGRIQPGGAASIPGSSAPLWPPPACLCAGLTVLRLRCPAVAADVFELLADLTVDDERRVVVVCGWLLFLPLLGAAAGLGPAQAEGSPPPPLLLPLPRILLLLLPRARWRWVLGDGSRP